MVLVQKWPFFHLFILGIIGQENVFSDILEGKKRLSKVYKQEVEKVEKLRFFLRGSPWFWSKIGHFSTVFFWAIEARKMCYVIFWKEKTFV